MKNVTTNLLLLALAISLSACGGSGSSNDMSVSHGRNNEDSTSPVAGNNGTQQNSNQQSSSGSNNGYKINKVVLEKLHTTKDNKDGVKSVVLSIGNQNYTVRHDEVLPIDLAKFPEGLNRLPIKVNGTANDGTVLYGEGFAKVYQQFYSAIMGLTTERSYEDGKLEDESYDEFSIGVIAGTPTLASNIPTQGSAVYQGKAFNRNSTGNLDYSINFADKSGQGRVTGLDTGTIVLEQGKLSAFTDHDDLQDKVLLLTDKNAQMLLGGKARYVNGTSGFYGVGLFGPHAEEIAGVVSDVDGDLTIGVGGSMMK